MKVLLIGNDEFVAESLIRGFLIENDKIMLVGSFDEEKLDPLMLEKIQYYHFEIASDKSEDLFIVNKPDIVVYFDNCQKNIDSDLTETEMHDHVNNMINAHYYAVKAKASKFLYISSTQLSEEYDGSLSNWGNAHNLCEVYLNDFNSHSSTMTIILRTSSMYGYGQNPTYCIICRLILSKIYKTQDVNIDLEQEVDLVHVDDFCAGVRRSLQSYKSHTYNIASGYKIALKFVYAAIEEINKIDELDLGGKQTPSVSISESLELIDYVPKIDLAKGLKLNYDRALEHKPDDTKKTFPQIVKRLYKRINRRAHRRINITNYLLNIALGLLVIFFSSREQLSITGIIDIKMLYLFIIVIFFDFSQAIIAVMFCVGLSSYEFMLLEESPIMLLYNDELAKTIFVLAITGLGGGLMRQRSIDEAKKHERSEMALREQLNHVKQMYYESLVVKDSLQGQVYNSNSSYGRVFSIMSSLNSLQITQLQYEIITFAEEIMQNRFISFYTLNRSHKYLRMVSKSETMHDLPQTIFVEQHKIARQVIKTKKMYINNNISKSADIVMASPMFYKEKVVAILIMHKANIEDLTLSYVNMFSITTDLANQAFNKAYAYKKAQEDEWYYEGTEVLKTRYYNERVQYLTSQAKKGITKFIILDIGARQSKKYLSKIMSLVRDIDFVGVSSSGSVQILLNNIDQKNIPAVQKRLAQNDISSRIVGINSNIAI